MPVTPSQFATSSPTLVVNTPDTLAIAVAGVFMDKVSLRNIANGDSFTLTFKQKPVTAIGPDVVDEVVVSQAAGVITVTNVDGSSSSWTNSANNPYLFKHGYDENDLVEANALQYIVNQTAGVGRTIYRETTQI